MKIENPTVYLDSSGVLKMCTQELPTEKHVTGSVCCCVDCLDYESKLRSVKDSSVEVRNREESIVFTNMHWAKGNPSFIIKTDTFYQLTGYTGEVNEEPWYAGNHLQGYQKYALITPSINNSLVEEESQEDIWMQVITECANTAEKVGAVRLIESLTSQFTVTRKK